MQKLISFLDKTDINYKVLCFDKDMVVGKACIYIHPYFSRLIKADLAITTSVGLKHKNYPFIKKLSHLPHSIVSLHMIYPEKSFNEFDYIFCSGVHHLREVQEINRLYNTNIKALQSGYTKLDLLYKVLKTKHLPANDKKVILLAPSWGEGNILQSLGLSLIGTIIAKGYTLIIRPHPMFFTQKQELIQKLKERCDNKTLFLENPTDSNDSFFKADVMISDYSGVAFEFAFLRESPILFVDVAKKVLNEKYRDIKTDPVEIALREDLGVISKPQIEDIINALEDIIENHNKYREKIISTRKELLFNYLNASNTISNQIKNIIKEL